MKNESKKKRMTGEPVNGRQSYFSFGHEIEPCKVENIFFPVDMKKYPQNYERDIVIWLTRNRAYELIDALKKETKTLAGKNYAVILAFHTGKSHPI